MASCACGRGYVVAGFAGQKQSSQQQYHHPSLFARLGCGSTQYVVVCGFGPIALGVPTLFLRLVALLVAKSPELPLEFRSPKFHCLTGEDTLSESAALPASAKLCRLA